MSRIHVKFEDDHRFRKAFLYVADKGSIDPEFGIVKINKALVFADILAMSTLGHTITRWKYLKFDIGPVPVNGHVILDEMKRGDLVRELPVPLFNHNVKRIVVLKQPDLNEFQAEELSLLDMAVGLVLHRSAKQVSNTSHKLPAWRWAVKDKLIDEGFLKYPFLVSEVKLSGARLEQALASAREQELV